MTHIEALAAAVEEALRDGLPIPLDIHTELLAHGINVEDLVPAIAADHQLSLIPLLDASLLDAHESFSHG